MLHDCCATHDLWVIWNAEYDSDIQFWIWPENRPRSGKRGQISKSEIFIKICLFFQFCLSIPNMPFILTYDNSKCQEICFKVTRSFWPDIISYILWFDHTFDLTSSLIRIKNFVGKVDIFRGINLIFFLYNLIFCYWTFINKNRHPDGVINCPPPEGEGDLETPSASYWPLKTADS